MSAHVEPRVVPDNLEVGTLAIPTTSYSHRGRPDTPRILVTAAVHGDEATAIGALWHLEHRLATEPFDGEVTVVRCVNVLAAQVSSRLTPLESADINRSFPGRRDGSLAERTAAALVDLLKTHDALIDVHTAGWCVPFILLDPIEDPDVRAKVAAWLAAADFVVQERYTSDKFVLVNEMPAAQIALQGLDRSWSAHAVKATKPAFTMELPGFHKLERHFAELGGEALFSLVKRYAAVHQGAADLATIDIDTLPHRAEMFAHATGFFEARCEPGDRVKKGQDVGWLIPLTGRDALTVQAASGGQILALPAISTFYPGAWLATIATTENADGEIGLPKTS